MKIIIHNSLSHLQKKKIYNIYMMLKYFSFDVEKLPTYYCKWKYVEHESPMIVVGCSLAEFYLKSKMKQYVITKQQFRSILKE